MIKEEHSIVIRRPVDEVFTFVSDQTNAPRWQQGLLEARRITEGVPGVGTRHVFVRKFLGRRLEAGNEYVEFEPNKKIVFKNTSGPMEFRAWYVTEAV
ncbi:MAG: SRPBCC family protein, partial [Nitrososphaerales archaeon]